MEKMYDVRKDGTSGCHRPLLVPPFARPSSGVTCKRVIGSFATSKLQPPGTWLIRLEGNNHITKHDKTPLLKSGLGGYKWTSKAYHGKIVLAQIMLCTRVRL